MNLRNLIENIKDPNPPANQSGKDKQSNNLRRRDQPQNLSHGKQHSQDNKNNSKYNQKKLQSSRSRDDPKHGANAHKTIQSLQQRLPFKKNDKTIKIPEKKIIDMERIREEHSQTSLQIEKNQRQSLPKTQDKGVGKELRISSVSDERQISLSSAQKDHKKIRRYQDQDSYHHVKKTVDIKDRVTRKKIVTSDAHDDHSQEHRTNHRKDDQYSDHDQDHTSPRHNITGRKLNEQYRDDREFRDSRQRQSASGVSSDNYQKQMIRNNKDTSSQISIKEKSDTFPHSDNLKIKEHKKRRVDKDHEKYNKSSEIATHQLEHKPLSKLTQYELKTVKTAKQDVSLKAFFTRKSDVKKSESKEPLLMNMKQDIKMLTDSQKQIYLKNYKEIAEKNGIFEDKNKNKLEENQTSNSKLLKQSQNTDLEDQQQLVDKAEEAQAKPRSESLGYKGHQTNHKFQISGSDDSKVFKIPKSKEHKFSEPMTSSVNHTPNDSKDSQNHSHHSDNVNMDEQERENDVEEQQLQQEPNEIPDEILLNQENNNTAECDQEMLPQKYLEAAPPILEENEFNNIVDAVEETGQVDLQAQPIVASQVTEKKLSLLSESEKSKLNAYIFTINNFISVSKLVLNRFVVYLQFIKDSYLSQIRDNKPQLLEILANSQEQFSQKTQVEFIKVLKCMMAGFENVKDFENALNEGAIDQSKKSSSNQRAASLQGNKEMKVNFTSIKHCIKRIQKACQMQIDDFQQKNGIYKEEILLGSIQDDQLSESELNEFMLNKRMLRERMKLLMDLIEIEQVSKQYLELFRRNFILLYELVKHDVMDIIFDDQINNQIDSGSDFEEHMRTRAYYIKYSNFSQFNQASFDVANVKNINSSIIDIFTSDELKQISSSTTLLVSLMEIGNTVDSVTIISKILDKKQKFIRINADCFDKFLIWKKRKCHCCMEYILDGGKAVTCVNIIQEQNPCKNIYCQNCVVAYLEQNSNLSMIENDEPEKEKNKEQKDKENKKLKHKLWLKAQQNILFICPCCQGMCLIEDKEKQKNLDFAKFSICNFNHRIINNPKEFLKKQFYWSRLTCNKRKFQLANVIGICKHKNIYKVELLSTSQIYQIKLQKEEIFFTDSVKNGSKLFKIINSEGFELDLKNIIDKQVKDFDNHSTYSILEKYKNYVDKPDQLNNGFIIPKFNYEQVQYRPEFVLETRNLMKRYDNQLFDSFELELQNICHNYNDEDQEENEIQNNSLFMSQQNNSATQQQFQPMILRQIKETDYRKLNNQGARLSDDEFEMVDNEPVKHFNIEKSMQKGIAKTPSNPFDKLKIERANIKNTPYELTMEPVNGQRDFYGEDDHHLVLEQHDVENQIIEQQMLQNEQEMPIDNNMMSQDQGEQWKLKQRHQILNDYQFKENYLADERFRLSHPNIGAMLVQEKNIQFAKDEMNRNQGDRIQLLVNRQVFRIERHGEQSNNPSYIDAIGEIKEMTNFQRPSETYEGQLYEQPFMRQNKYEQPLFDVERGASRDQIIEDYIEMEYDQENDHYQEPENLGPPRPYKIRKIGDSAVIVYDDDTKANEPKEKQTRRKRSHSPKPEEIVDREVPTPAESFQKPADRNYYTLLQQEGDDQHGFVDVDEEKDVNDEDLNSRDDDDDDESMEDDDDNRRSRSGSRNQQSQKQMDATRRKQEKARLERDKKIKEQEKLMQFQEEQRDIRLAKREEIKRINIFNQIQKRKKQAEARKALKELGRFPEINGGKSETEQEEDDDSRQVKQDDEIDEIKDKKIDDEKSQNTVQQLMTPPPEKKWKKPKVHADRLMQQSFLANQTGFRSLMVDRQKQSSSFDRLDIKIPTDLQDQFDDAPTNKQKKEAIKQYSEQQKLFTQQHKASPTKIIKNRMLKEKGEPTSQIDLDYLKALEIGEKKEYNLRAGRQKPSPIVSAIPKNILKPVFAEKDDEKEESDDESERPQVVIDTKIEPRVTRGAIQEKKEVEEEFYDDFPIEIIKKYNLKISNKRKEEIYLSRKRKTNLKQANQKINPNEEQKNKEVEASESQLNTQQLETEERVTPNYENFNQQEEKQAKHESIAENKDSSNSEPNKQDHQNKDQTGEKPNYDKLYFRRFVMRPKIEEHHQKLHQIVLTNPHELIGFYIYIYRKSQNLWRRAFIKNFFQGEESKRIYEIEYQNEAKLTKQINLMKVIFIIDYSSESPKNSQDLSKLSKQQSSHNLKESEVSNGLDEEARKSIGKLKNYSLFNNKKRVSKMLQKIEEQLEKVESKKGSPQINQEIDNNSSLSKLSSQKFQKVEIEEEPADAEMKDEIKVEELEQVVEPVQEEEKILPAPIKESIKELSLNVAEEEKKFQMDEAEIKEEEKEEESEVEVQVEVKVPVKVKAPVAHVYPVKRSTTPKESWIKDMKQKLLSKTRQTSSNQKILKFYHQEIEIDEDFSKSNDSSEEVQQKISKKSPVQAKQTTKIQQQQQQSIFPPHNQLKNQHKVSFKLKNNPNDQATNHAQITQDLQQYELQLQHQQQNFIAQKQVHDQQNEKINNMILQINNQEMIKQSQFKNGEIESQDFNSARDMVQQKLLLSRLQQKSYLIDEQKQKYKEQIQQLYALDLDKPENKENRKIFEQLTYEFEQYCIMQQFMDQIYQQQIQAYFMRQQLDERSLNRDAPASNEDRKNSLSKDAESDAEKQAQFGPQMQEMDDIDPQIIDDKNSGDPKDLDKKMLAGQLEQYNQFQQMQIEYASKNASQQMMNQFYNEKNNYLLMNQVLSAEYLLNLKQQYANELLQEDKEQEDYELLQQQRGAQNQSGSYQNQQQENDDVQIQDSDKKICSPVDAASGAQAIVENAENIEAAAAAQAVVVEEAADQQTWEPQFSYLKQIQQLLDRIGKIDENPRELKEDNDEQLLETKQTFEKIEKGIKILEQTFQEEKYIEQEIIEILNLDHNQQLIIVPNLLNQFKNEVIDEQSNQKVAGEQQIKDNNNPEDIENSPKSKQQILDGSEIKPEFFFEHINYLAELKKKQQATISLNFQMRDNQQGDEPESINPSVLNQFDQLDSSNMQILQEVLDRFYQKQIVFNGFKKCKCQSCFKMVNPILIKYDAESNEYQEQHQQQYISYSTMQNPSVNDFKNSLNAQLRHLFTLKKSEDDIQLCLKYQKEKIQKFDKNQEDEDNQIKERGDNGNLGTDKEEYLKKYPCFKLLVKRIIEEEENIQEKQNQESQKKQVTDENKPSENLLPKLSQIFPENIKTSQVDFNIDLMEKQFEDQIKLLLDQNPEKKDNSEEQNEQDIVSQQVKLDLMKTMQKMLVQFKLLKQLEKPKFEKNFGRAINHGSKQIKSLVSKKRQAKENVKLAEKQKRIQMQNYINSLYRNQYLGQRFGDDENKIWDYTTIQAPGSHPYNYMFQNDVNMQNEPPVNFKTMQQDYAPPQPDSGYNYDADMYFAQQQAMMQQQHVNFQEEMVRGQQALPENPYMYQQMMAANYRGPKQFMNGNQQPPVYNMNTFSNAGDNHMTNYNSNFNNCQIFQPQIINQNYLTTMPPQQHSQHEERVAQPDGPKPLHTDIEQSKQSLKKEKNVKN